MRQVSLALLLCGSLLAGGCITTPISPVADNSPFRTATTIPTPCPTPTPVSHDCRVTGGGFIEYVITVDPKVTFGFNASDLDGVAKGEVEVVDHGTGQNFHGTVTDVTCVAEGSGKKVSVTYTITGNLDQQSSGYPGTFTLIVRDDGEPGNENSGKGSDTFNFTVNSGSLSGYNRSGVLQGGNIQAHEY